MQHSSYDASECVESDTVFSTVLNTRNDVLSAVYGMATSFFTRPPAKTEPSNYEQAMRLALHFQQLRSDLPDGEELIELLREEFEEKRGEVLPSSFNMPPRVSKKSDPKKKQKSNKK